MITRKSNRWTLAAFLLLLSCTDGQRRGCASSCAQELGADWIIVQYKYDGTPTACWKLEDVSVANEEASDGVYWRSEDGHLIHISGWYNRVQVEGSGYESAAKAMGIDLKRCVGGTYGVAEGNGG